MDLISLFRSFRRHWLVALPFILLTGAALVWVLFVRPVDFEASGNVVLLAPPGAPPGPDGNPQLTTPAGKTDSPLARFGDQSVVVRIVSEQVSTNATRDELKAEGADTRYEIAPSFSGPIAEITAVAASAEQAEQTVALVAQAFVDTLAEIQKNQGVDPTYAISTLPIEPPEKAQPKVSSSVRLAVGVVGLGLITTFFAVSVAEARDSSRRQREARDPDADADGRDDGYPPPSPGHDGNPGAPGAPGATPIAPRDDRARWKAG
jgi:hypothetical protein